MRTILHVDMDAFFASVEQHRRPELRGRPVVVGAEGPRGVVAAASYEARAYGVHSAMPSLRARRLCPDAVFVAGDHARYAEVSASVMAVFASITPLVEPLSLDEAFLDVSGAARLLGDGPRIADEVRTRVLDAVGLTCSVGVAPNKFLAKLATEEAKPSASRRGPVPGRGVAVVEPGRELEFLRPLPVGALWGVGPKTREKLSGLGVRTVADLADLPLPLVVRAVGDAHGRHLHQLAHGVDDRPVVPERRPKSIGHEETFAVDIADRDRLQVELVRMGDAVAARARHHGLPGRTVTIKVRFGDFRTITRSITTDRGLDTGPAVVRIATELLDEVDIAPGVRLLGVSLGNLGGAPARQLSLDDLAERSSPGGQPTATGPSADGPAWTAVTEALDAVRAKFGDDALLPGRLAVGGGLRAKRRGDQQWGPGAPVDDDGHS